jgi:thiamine biosynthesis lipoprotein
LIVSTKGSEDQALSTSGNYQKYVNLDGHTIGHLIDPHTGGSVSSMLSGTVVAPTAIEIDALSTALVVLGVGASHTVLSRSKEVQFLAVVQNDDGEELV